MFIRFTGTIRNSRDFANFVRKPCLNIGFNLNIEELIALLQFIKKNHEPMKIHFIAIGGSAMHNLAIALHLKGYQISGSDDEIFNPAKERLQKYGILPQEIGWFPEKIDTSVDAVVLGMHARADNPELLKANELGIKVYSYPEFLYEQCKDKKRVVIGGSHGKTTITAMIIHVLQQCNVDCDYMVGAQLDGFEVMVKLSETADVAIIEGDEYLTSPIDRRPKFHVYQPNIGVISGIAWDHINVFPTFEIYVNQFKEFINLIPEDGALIYYQDDPVLEKICESVYHTSLIPYSNHLHDIKDGKTYLATPYGDFPLKVFGKHNLANLNAARLVCVQLGIEDLDFYKAITSFSGANKRLELLAENEKFIVYQDFAHSPSKLKATIEAIREQFPEKRVIACMELHTFSSLTESFLQEYQGSMDQADIPIVFFNPQALEHKKLPPLTQEMIFDAFENQNIEIFNDSQELTHRILSLTDKDSVFLFMSSGNFSGVDLNNLANKIVLLQA